MKQPCYETFREITHHGIRLSYLTIPGGYHPLHWHEDLEILYTLNGEADIIVEGKKYCLLCFFSINTAPKTANLSPSSFERLQGIITYVEKHFRKPISLQAGANQLGLSKEYFCRFFKKNMGMSFLEYINEVRLTHIYHDLIYTDTPISILIEENGFTNQKLFNRLFKKLYGCTPSFIRTSTAVSAKRSATSTILHSSVQNLE